MRVDRRADGRVWGEFALQPGGHGPPLHVHASTPERVHVLEGRMGARVGDVEREFLPGESIEIPPATPHRFFNAGEETAVTRVSEEGVPEILALCVSQLWGMANDPQFQRERSMAVQLLLISPRCDIWAAGLPLWLQRAMHLAVAPTARLLGYRTAYPRYARRPD